MLDGSLEGVIEMATETVEKVKQITLMSVYHKHKIDLRGASVPVVISADNKVVRGTPIKAKYIQFEENEAKTAETWMEFVNDEGEDAGLRHTEGYGSDFVEKEKLAKALRDTSVKLDNPTRAQLKKKEDASWSLGFLKRMNYRRMIVTPVLGELEKMDIIQWLDEGGDK